MEQKLGQQGRENLEYLLDKAYNTISLAAEVTGIGSWDWNLTTDEVFYDDQWIRMIGFEPDEVNLGNDFWEKRIHPDDKEEVLKTLDLHLQGTIDSYKTEHRLLAKSGNYIWVLDVGKVIERDAFQKPVRIIGISMDISEKIAVQNKIKKSEAKYKSIFEHLNDAFCRFDFQGYILEVNSNLCQMLGLDEEALIGSNLKIFFHNNLFKYLYRRLTSIIENKSLHFETEIITLQGQEIPVNISARLITQQGKGIIQALIRDITERRNSEKALLEEKQRFKILVEHSPNSILRFGKNLRCQFASSNSNAILNVYQEEFKDKRLGEIFQSLSLSKFLEDKLKWVFKRNEVSHVSFSADTKIGTSHFEAVIVPEMAQNETAETILMTISDVTDKILGETERKVSKFRLEEAEKKVHFGTYEAYTKSGLMIWSKETYTIYERDFNLMPPTVEDYYYTFVHPDDFKTVTNNLYTSLSQFKEINQIYRIITAGGNVKFIHDIASIEKDTTTGEPHKIVGALIDITDKKQVENKLAEEHDTFQLIMDNVPDPIYMKDKEGRFIRANKALADLFLLDDPARVIGKTFYDFVSKEVADDFEQHEMSLFATGRPVINQENRICFPAGTFYFSTTMIGITDSSGKISQLVCISRDISQYKIIQEQLVLAKEHAESADKLKSAFLANMSHEIRTPINGILGFANILEMREFSRDKEILYLQIINNSGKLLLSLINDIIDIAKIEAGQIAIEPSIVDLKVLFGELADFYKCEFIHREKEAVQLIVSIPQEDHSDHLITDPFRLKQIINNLIVNALKFTDVGFIEIGYHLMGNEILFFVKDSGVGMSAEETLLIFDRFKQAGNASKKKEGTGLGLAISKGLVELLDGRIWVQSEPGKGSVFYFTLPATFASELPSRSTCVISEKSTKDYNWSDKHLLLVEDEEVNTKFIHELLTDTGINLMHVTTGEEAVEICRTNHQIDLILMDIRLPGINGFETTRKIKSIRKDLPVIAQTAYAMQNEKKSCLEAGCDRYLTKPFIQKDLLNAINDFLSS